VKKLKFIFIYDINRTETTATKMAHNPDNPARDNSGSEYEEEPGVCVPMDPKDVLSLFRYDLTEYENDEILEYPHVYYIGQEGKVQAVKGAPKNNGFDDSTGRYAYRQGDHIAYRYQLTEPIGKGAFGDCYMAFDHKEGQWVAMKIIRNEPRFHQQGKSEVAILELLREHDADDKLSVVRMFDTFMFRSHLVITFELLGENLYTVLRKGGFKGFGPNATRAVGMDILRCLMFLEAQGIVHADLKPENIILRCDALPVENSGSNTPLPSVAKVIDFGSSCFRHGDIHTYIQSRYYRSPEIVLGMGYGPPADMWSFGCILFEIGCGYPLFPVKCESDLLVQMMELLGIPPLDVQVRSHRRGDFFNSSSGKPLTTTDSKGRIRPPGTRELADCLQDKGGAFTDIVSRCLTWNPNERITPGDAMKHPWITGKEFVPPVQDSLFLDVPMLPVRSYTA
jgi:dual specificity tyrosine-phosphorylation-regulated kinase 2/3/4